MSRKKRDIPERLNPGDPEPLRCSPGSIEQQLDMCETEDLRGDEIQHNHGLEENGDANISDNPEEMMNNFQVNMSEENREGDEMSGDEHSSGLQGGEPELEFQPGVDAGLPGDRTRVIGESELEIKKRAS